MTDPARIAALRLSLFKDHFDVPEDVAVRAYEAAMAEPAGPIYAVGDFICFYEGMGESGFGTIKKILERGYLLDTFAVAEWGHASYERRVYEPSGHSTPEEAKEYARMRMGK